MFWFIAGLVLLAVGGVVFGLRKRISDTDRRALVSLVGLVLLGLGAFTVLMNSFTIVPARNVGIVVTFGKAEAAIDNGFHLVKPWSDIQIIDATQKGFDLDKDTNNCATVRLANQTTACVDLTLQWHVDQKGNANELWQRYRGTNDDVIGNIGLIVVKRELQAALNAVFEPYDPLAGLTATDPAPTVKTSVLATDALNQMRLGVDSGIVIDKLLISIVHFDETTQAKLNGFAQALADTQIATQQKLTAQQQKEANDYLAAASSSDPGVMYQNCLNLVKDLAAKGQLQYLPPTFTCGASNGTPVIVGQK